MLAAEDVTLLFTTLEICSNYDIIVDAIEYLLFFTDGDEASKVNVINKLKLDDVQIGENIIFVGVGGSEDLLIPRYNSRKKWVGYWPPMPRRILPVR